jgi:UDP:flavonoid glycosyltransferase YjiC (YdhE family)
MIRQKVWEERFSDEIGQHFGLNEVSDKDLRETVNRVLGDFNIAKNRRIVKQDGFLEGLFSALGPIMRRAVAELERREADKRSSSSTAKNMGHRGSYLLEDRKRRVK